MRDGCPFCDFDGPILRKLGGVIVFEPLQPVTPGHILVVPREHVANAVEDPSLTGIVYSTAALVARSVGPCNLITSVGREATQTIDHLHVHVVPRREGDRLSLPWSRNRDSTTKGRHDG